MLSPAERTLRARIAANRRWANEDRNAAADRQREVILRRFEDQVDPERRLPEAERLQRARNAMRAHMAQLSLRAAKARRKSA